MLADGTRPGRNQEAARIAAWEAHHLIENGGEIPLIALWLRAAGEPPPDPVAPPEPPPLRLGQAARLLVILGPGDVPARSEHLRLAARAAGAVGGWAQLRGFLDGLDLTTPDARRAVRAAVGAMQPKALMSRRAWNALRSRLPRLPEADAVGVGEPRRKQSDEGDGSTASRPRRRRRRRLRAGAENGGNGANGANGASGGNGGQPPAEGQPERRDPAAGAPGEGAPKEGAAPARRRRRRRRRPRAAAAGDGSGNGGAPDASGPPPPAEGS